MFSRELLKESVTPDPDVEYEDSLEGPRKENIQAINDDLNDPGKFSVII